MKRFLSSAMTVAAVSAAMTAQTTVQGIPWRGPASVGHVAAMSAPAKEPRAISPSEVTSWTGTGSKSSYLVIQWDSDRDTHSHVFGYRYDGSKSGWDMISDIVAAHPQLYMLTHVTSMGNTVAGIGFDVDGNGRQLLRRGDEDAVRPGKENSYVVTTAYDYDSWTPSDSGDLWNSGWISKGYWSYYVKGSMSDGFEYSQEGASKRQLSDGSVDGWMFRPSGASDSEWKPALYDSAPITETVASGGLNFRPVNSMGVGSEAFAVVAPAADGAYSGQISVPATVALSGKDCTVSAVAPSAFAGSAITSFTTSVADLFLGDEAFSGCASLASVVMPESWTGPYLSEGVFENCSSLAAVPFPAGCTVIPARYAAGSGLTSFEVSKEVKTISAKALAAPGLVSVKSLSRQPAECAADAFSPAEGAVLTVPLGCSSLYAESDGWNAFSSIEEYTPEGYVPVGTKFQVGDFWYEVTSNEPNEVCVAYPGASTPTSLSAASSNAYKNVAASIFTSGGMQGREWQLRLPLKVEYPGKGEFAVTGIGAFAFANVSCPTVKNLTIRDSEGDWNYNIRYIGAYAFAANNSSGFYLPPMTEKIGEYAFSNMNELITLDCDSDDPYNPSPLVTVIPAGMCSRDTKLRYCTVLSNKVTKIGAEAFYYRPKDFCVESELTSLEEVGDGAFRIGYYTPATDYVYPFRITDKLRKIGSGAFAGCQMSIDGGSTFTMYKDGVYGSKMFENATGIERIVVEEGIKEIPDELYYSLKSLTSLELPSSLETIGKYAFTWAGLKSVKFPEGLKTIGDRAFMYTGLTRVDLPASVEVCDGLWSIACLTEINIPEDSKLRSANFSMTGISTLFVPDGVTTMPSFANCKNFRGYTGARNVTILPPNAFLSTSTEVAVIPPKTTIIGDFAWASCENLKELVIPEGVTSLGDRIAWKATSLERIVLPASVKTVGKNFGAFSGVPESTDLWMCLTDYTKPGYYASYLMPEVSFGSYAGQNFAHYYVLSGTKAGADKWAGSYFSTTEVNLEAGFPDENAVASTYDSGLDRSDVEIEVAPVVSLSVEGLTEEDIPAAFMDANMKLALSEPVIAGEYRLRDTEDPWQAFTVETVAPVAEARTMPEWKYVMKADRLMPGEEYEYRLYRQNGQAVEPEGKTRYFTAAYSSAVGVEEIDCGSAEAVRVYDAAGRLLPGLSKGLNIVVDSEGKARKVMVF